MRTWSCVAGLLMIVTVTLVPQDTAGPDRFTMRVLATGLEGPWEIAWGPDRQLWVTERVGKRIVRIDPANGSKTVAATVAGVHQSVTQDGLLGLVFHPDFSANKGTEFVYVAYTYDDDPGAPLARRLAVRRYRYDARSGMLGDPADILRGLPSHDDHVAGRLAIGPDRRLYLSLGDGGANFGQNRCMPNDAQTLPTAADVQARNWSAYWGKILRLELDGSIPADNPTIDGVRSHIYSYGHRNPLGLAFGPNGLLYESEHGPSSDDEVNLIGSGRNYGWPQVAGFKDDKAYVYYKWSRSAPQPCASLPRGENPVPSSVPSETELSWNHARFTPPLRTFFTVDTADQIRGIGSATIAPGGLDVYSGDAIPGWKTSVLALSLIRGTLYRLPLSVDGRSIAGPSVELFRTANRYRDLALNPDGRTIYIATDPTGPYRDASGTVTQAKGLVNPGSILAFTLDGAVAPAAPRDADRRDWIQLFNGRNLDGWTPKMAGYPLGENFADTFRVENGILKVAYDKYSQFANTFGHLFYDREAFSHYNLVAEYRFVDDQVPGGPAWAARNNGLMLHSQAPQSMTLKQDFPISIEVQLLGGAPAPDRTTANVCTPGTEIFMKGTMVRGHCTNSSSAVYRGDTWVRVEVEVRGSERIRHIVEGQPVLEYEMLQVGGGSVNNFDPAVKQDGLPLDRGFIAIQGESHPTEFRRIELLNLSGCMNPKSPAYRAHFVHHDESKCGLNP